MLDHRLVQTAVIGHKHSDQPVILPMDAYELDAWRKAHPRYTYWCGLQLGGCGGELTDRRYTTKVCHFAHHRSAPTCYRTANGESSADHLFIKQGVQRLLAKQKVRGKVSTRDLGRGRGPVDAVDVQLPDSRRRLRFQLSSLDYRSWRRANDELAGDVDSVDWLFGTDGPLTQELMARYGFSMRVRLETVGAERRVHIGTEARDRSIAWTPLEDCAVTSSGIVTPRVEEIRLTSPRPTLPAIPLQGGLAFVPVPDAPVPPDSPFAVEGRQLLVADLKPASSSVVRAYLSLPGDTDAPPAQHVYRIPDGARIRVGELGQGWAVEATRYVQLNVHEAEKTGLWAPPPQRIEHSQHRSGAEPRQETMQRTASIPSQRAETAPVVPRQGLGKAVGRQLTREDLVSAVRDALLAHARLRSTTRWADLVATVGPKLDALPTSERRRLLMDVDRPLREHVPLLSVLIREGGGPLPYLRDVLSGLGVPFASVSTDISEWAAVEIERAFAAHGTPATTMPVRPSLKPAEGTQATVAAKSGQTVVGARLPHGSGRHPVRVPAGTVSRVRALVGELEGLLPQVAEGWARGRAEKRIEQARKWLEVFDGGLSEQERARRANQVLQDPEGLLGKALDAVRADLEAVRQSEPVEEQGRAVAGETRQPVSRPKKAAKGSDRLARQLVTAAVRRRTIPAEALRDGRSASKLLEDLAAVDRSIAPDVLLTAIVTGADGGPVSFFRELLVAAGLAVPKTDEVLLKIWQREQERAFAAYAGFTESLPLRLVPPAATGESVRSSL